MQAGIKMPDKPTYDQIAEYAAKLTDKSKEQYGFCQRGKPGWGENMAFVGPMVNAFGGRWFDEKWEPQLTSEPWKNAVTYYVKNMKEYGPPGATANGHNENRALFATGHCAMWVDATSAAGYIFNPEGKPGRRQDRLSPRRRSQVTSNGSGWFWAWSLGIPASSKKADAAKSFVKWATSKDYITTGRQRGRLGVGSSRARASRPTTIPSTRRPHRSRRSSTSRSPMPTSPSRPRIPVPYIGIQYVAIPEFQGIGTVVGQQIAAALAGQVDGRPGARDRAALDRADHEAGRLSEVS